MSQLGTNPHLVVEARDGDAPGALARDAPVVATRHRFVGVVLIFLTRVLVLTGQSFESRARGFQK